jgi:hypothetical protein
LRHPTINPAVGEDLREKGTRGTNVSVKYSAISTGCDLHQRAILMSFSRDDGSTVDASHPDINQQLMDLYEVMDCGYLFRGSVEYLQKWWTSFLYLHFDFCGLLP